MKTKLTVIVVTLAMIIGCLDASTVLAQGSKDIASKKERRKDERKVDAGYGFSHELVNVGPSITPEDAVPKLIKGKTTLDEVLLLLGKPEHLNMYGEGGRMAMYLWRTELRMGTPNIGRTMGEAVLGPFTVFKLGRRFEKAQRAMEEVKNSVKTLTANFGSDGVLKDFVVNPPIMPAKPEPPSNLKIVTPPQDKAENAQKTSDPPSLTAAHSPPPHQGK